MTKNKLRQNKGRAALAPYSPRTEGVRDAMVDLFANVIHYAAQKLTIPEIRNALDMAIRHWEREEQDSESLIPDGSIRSNTRGRLYTYHGVRYVPRCRKAPSTFKDAVTCGNCGRTWDNGQSTDLTPTPSGRCPFEYLHASC
jgi:hypothetical protein